jgi:hypothetical protein
MLRKLLPIATVLHSIYSDFKAEYQLQPPL